MAAISEPYELDGVSVSTTELSVTAGTTGLQTRNVAGIYEGWFDPIGSALAKGDEFRGRVYEKVLSGSTQRVALEWLMCHAEAQNWEIAPLFLMHGWDYSLLKVTGTDRNWDASVRTRASSSVISQLYSMTGVTVSTTEISIVTGTSSLATDTTDGLYQLWVDFNTLAKGDEFIVRGYEKVEGTGGTKRLAFYRNIKGTQSELFVTPPIVLINGWDYTLQKAAGTDRSPDCSIRKAA